jgi:hypothetical protein
VEILDSSEASVGTDLVPPGPGPVAVLLCMESSAETLGLKLLET